MSPDRHRSCPTYARDCLEAVRLLRRTDQGRCCRYLFVVALFFVVDDDNDGGGGDDDGDDVLKEHVILIIY